MATFNSANLPTGWAHDVANQQYRGPNGEIITDYDLQQYGSFSNALMTRYNQTQMKMHSYRPSNPKVGDVVVNAGLTEIYTNNGWVANHHITNAGAASMVNNGGVIASSPIQPASTLSFETDHGKVSINIKSGELTIPAGMGRQDAIREFWLGFQENFNPHPEATKYKNEISWWKKKAEDLEQHADEYAKYAFKEAYKKIAEKIAAKYRGEKFIMVKPEDLIRFIEGE